MRRNTQIKPTKENLVKKLTTAAGVPVADDTNSVTAGSRGGMMIQNPTKM